MITKKRRTDRGEMQMQFVCGNKIKKQIFLKFLNIFQKQFEKQIFNNFH